MTFGERKKPMKRTELKRGTARLRTDPVKQRAWQRGSAKALPQYSETREAERPARRALVDRVLKARPACEARLAWCCTFASTEVNEIMRRGQWAKGYLVDENTTALCHDCHQWITFHRSWALFHGHEVRSTATVNDFTLATVIRSTWPGLSCLKTCATDHRLLP